MNPTSVSFPSASGNTLNSTLSMTATAGLQAPHDPRTGGAWFAATGGFFATVILGSIPGRRRWLVLLGFVLLAIAIASAGCGGGGSHSTVQQNLGPQTFIVTVTGTSASLTHSADVSFTVQ